MSDFPSGTLEPVLVSFADDELIIGHRHSEWTGWAPHIEEDIAFSSIAQDELGHAALFYQLLSEVTGRTPDEYALGRMPSEYRNAQICERPNRDWAYTLARHFLYDAAERLRLESFTASEFAPLADAAEKILREERYHQLHADAWLRRLAAGGLEGRHQLGLALSEAFAEAAGLFEPIESESAALDAGVLSKSHEQLLNEWLSEVLGRIDEVGLALTLESSEGEGEFLPTSTGELIEQPNRPTRSPVFRRDGDRFFAEGDFPAAGGRRGVHSEDFEQLWEDLTKTYREEPTATW